LTIQELEEKDVSLVVRRFEEWVVGRNLRTFQLSCGEAGLEIEIAISAQRVDSLRLNAIDCSRFSCP
jgi:hypothetical protein